MGKLAIIYCILTIVPIPHSPLQPLVSAEIEAAGVQIFIKRDDLLHPLVSGNKWRKLKYNLVEMQRQNHHTLLTFGGAYSNHIYATAAAGKLFDFKTIGLIRGEECFPVNPTLSFAQECGMRLHYLDRAAYKEKENDIFLKGIKSKFGECYLLPEGGSNAFAIQGCKELVEEINIPFDIICTACGTGATLAGIIAGLKPHQKALGFSALKAVDYFESKLPDYWNGATFSNHLYEVKYDYHFGGYAKMKTGLIQFMDRFTQTFNIPLDPIYTGKMMYGLFDLIKKQYFPRGTTIIAVHTGGLQGLRGMKEKMEMLRK